MFRSVCIYSGHRTPLGLVGPYAESVEKGLHIFTSLKGKAWKVFTVEGAQLAHTLQSSKVKETLLVIPAGQSSRLDETLGSEVEAIQMFVREGGSLFASCGAAYWLSSKRVWGDRCDANPHERVFTKKTNPAAFFLGKAWGPLCFYPGQEYNAAFWHGAIRLTNYKGKTIRVLLSGGGAFFPGKEEQQVESLATYCKDELSRFSKDEKWSDAIIRCDCGKGTVILSMVHPMYGAEEIDVDAYAKAFPDRADNWREIRDNLSPKKERLAFMEEIIASFGSV